MIETLTILPMAPGTRSRRTDVLHRATPVLLPKPRQRQTTLDQHVQRVRVQGVQGVQSVQQGAGQRSSTNAPPPSRQLTPLQPPRQQPKQQTQRQPTESSRHTQPLVIASQTHSIQNILNNAESMGTTARPKRKAAADTDANVGTNANVNANADAGADDRTHLTDAKANTCGKDITSCSATDDLDVTARKAADEASRKRPRLAVKIVEHGVSGASGASGASSRGPGAPAKTVAPLKHASTTGAAVVMTTTAAKTPAAEAPAAAAPVATPTATPTETATETATGTATRTASAIPNRVIAPAPGLPTTVRSRKSDRSTAAAAPPTSTQPWPTSLAQPRAAGPPAAEKPKDKHGHGHHSFKYELKGLQVSTADAEAAANASRDGGRKLRSQEASRFRSELSAYFPDYDEVIGNEEKEEHMLDIDTPILLVASSAAHPAGPPAVTTASSRAPSLRSSDHTGVPVKGYGDKLFYDVFDSHVLDFAFLGNQHKSKGAVDPLPNTYFEAHHKRAERLERSIRNTEKGRAQHERDQIVRLLEGLQGPDWLRTMGVSGITESKKKTFEPARDHFIRGCRIILEKFRLWSQEEKRRKQEKDRVHAEEVRAREAATEAEAEAAASADGGSRGPRGKGKARADAVGPKSRRRRDAVSKESGSREATSADVCPTDGGGGSPGGEEEMDLDSQPDSSDFDAVIALQLRQEALARSRFASQATATNTSASHKRRKTAVASAAPTVLTASTASTTSTIPAAPVAPIARTTRESARAKRGLRRAEEEVKSFFQKPYQREAALSKGRRKGRTVMAWGQPIPELPEMEFNLPDAIISSSGGRGVGDTSVNDGGDVPGGSGRRTRSGPRVGR